jgi:hypothetical protein
METVKTDTKTLLLFLLTLVGVLLFLYLLFEI